MTTNQMPISQYQLLGRLQQDVEYYLGAGNGNKKHLWALDETLQIQKMKEIYESLPVKPEWITLEVINSYEEKMAQKKQSACTETIKHPWVVVTDAGTDRQSIYDHYPSFSSARIGLSDLAYSIGKSDIMKRLDDGTLTTEF